MDLFSGTMGELNNQFLFSHTKVTEDSLKTISQELKFICAIPLLFNG